LDLAEMEYHQLIEDIKAIKLQKIADERAQLEKEKRDAEIED
jgi:hypothetical protein